VNTGINIKQGLLEKSKLDQNAYEEGLKVSRDEARILQIEITADIGNTMN
jgi:hypothetical protein